MALGHGYCFSKKAHLPHAIRSSALLAQDAAWKPDGGYIPRVIFHDGQQVEHRAMAATRRAPRRAFTIRFTQSTSSGEHATIEFCVQGMISMQVLAEVVRGRS